MRVASIVIVAYCLSSSAAMSFGQVNVNAEEALKKAEATAAAIEALGPKLVEVVADTEAPIANRIEAAKLLGELQFGPGVDPLIKFMGIADPRVQNIDADQLDSHPLIGALGKYENEAVFSLVDAYLDEPDGDTRQYLFLAIKTGGTADVALRYLQGIERPNEGQVLEFIHYQQLQELLQEIVDAKKPAK